MSIAPGGRSAGPAAVVRFHFPADQIPQKGDLQCVPRSEFDWSSCSVIAAALIAGMPATALGKGSNATVIQLTPTAAAGDPDDNALGQATLGNVKVGWVGSPVTGHTTYEARLRVACENLTPGAAYVVITNRHNCRLGLPSQQKRHRRSRRHCPVGRMVGAPVRYRPACKTDARRRLRLHPSADRRFLNCLGRHSTDIIPGDGRTIGETVIATCTGKRHNMRATANCRLPPLDSVA